MYYCEVVEKFFEPLDRHRRHGCGNGSDDDDESDPL
jgi:hypothetical protein